MQKTKSKLNQRVRIEAMRGEPIREDGSVQIFPAGEFSGAITGRGPFVMTDARAAKVIAAFDARKTRLVCDYEHQTMLARQNGQPAPAAGWHLSLEWQPGVGMFAVIDWTVRAKAAIRRREYLYYSPVFRFDEKTGEVIELLNGALTNFPDIDGMREAIAASGGVLSNDDEVLMTPEEIAALRAALGLPEDATPEQILAAVKSQKTAVAAASATVVDPAKYAPVAVVAQLTAQVASLTAHKESADVAARDALVATGLADGRILAGAHEAWARSQNLAALTAFMGAAQPIAALTGTQTKGQPPAAGASGVTPQQSEIARRLGLAPDALKETT